MKRPQATKGPLPKLLCPHISNLLISRTMLHDSPLVLNIIKNQSQQMIEQPHDYRNQKHQFQKFHENPILHFLTSISIKMKASQTLKINRYPIAQDMITCFDMSWTWILNDTSHLINRWLLAAGRWLLAAGNTRGIASDAL